MTRHDHRTTTVSGAAAYERARTAGYHAGPAYTAADAAYDAACDAEDLAREETPDLECHWCGGFVFHVPGRDRAMMCDCVGGHGSMGVER
ncbi:hypothetical protein H8E07_10125 [bacterium]|nr:hypothetical protein [bacterium]